MRQSYVGKTSLSRLISNFPEEEEERRKTIVGGGPRASRIPGKRGFEKDVLKAVMAQDSGFSVRKVVLHLGGPGAAKKCSQPGRTAAKEMGVGKAPTTSRSPRAWEVEPRRAAFSLSRRVGDGPTAGRVDINFEVQH